MKKPGLLFRIIIITAALVFAIDSIWGQTQTFSANGTFTVPPGITSINVECWGGGGGGSTITSNGARGGGGGGGAYASSIVSVISGTSYNVVVGTGGAANTNGLSSTFNGTTVVAAGGNGGSNNSATAGAGGSTGSSTGDIEFSGGNGANGGGTWSGGGGGGAGSTGAGSNAPTAANGSFGSGTTQNGGNGGASVSGSNNGNNGINYGGGGSGASTNSNTDRNGGTGSDGYVVISWSEPIYISSGTFTVPSGVTSIVVECWGGGGGGSSITSNGARGGGGGGGAYAGSIVSVIPGNSYNVEVGTGGAASTNGGSSTFNSTTVIAAGGNGGSNNSATAGSGGSTGTSTGDTEYAGGNGANGGGTWSGGGGGGAGSTGAGGNAPTAANGSFGTGTTQNGGNGGASVSGSSDGNSASLYSGGGSGASTNTTTNRNGGPGAKGLVVVTLPFFSSGNNDPANLTNWWSNPNGTGFHPTSFTSNNQIFIIQNGNSYSTSAGWTVSGKNTMVKIENGGILQANHAISLSANTIFRIENGGTYNQNHNINNIIFSGSNSFATGSTVNYMLNGDQTVATITYSNLVLSGSGAKTITGITVNDRLSLEGIATTIGSTPAYGSAAAINYMGSSPQTTGIELPATFNGTGGIILNNASGVTLSSSITVSTALTMTQGNLNTGSFIFTISNGLAGSLAYSSGTIIGRIKRRINTTLATDYLFPVGTAGFYRPASFNFTAISAVTDITAEFIATPPSGFTGYTDGVTPLNNAFTEGYWRFSSSGPPTATYNITLTGDGFTSYSLNEVTRITGRDNSNSTWRALGTHASQSGNEVSRTGVTNLNSTSFDFALANGCGTISMGYGYERDITIDYTKVSGGENLFNFPMLVTLSGQTFLRTSPTGQITSSNGYDIIFTDNNYNKLDHQIEYYNGTNGDLIAWVRIPILSSTSNTVIKIMYGNSQVITDLSVTSVWDSQYKGVWHLDNSSLNDFTSYNKSGTAYNTPAYPAGQISNALGLNGSTQYVEVLNDPNINFAGNITISAWVRMTTGARDQKIASNQNNSSGGYKFGVYTNNKVEFEIRNSANTPSLNRDEPNGTVLVTNQWYYLAGMSSDVLDSIKTFVNGIPERPFKKTGILGVASDNLVISKEPFSAQYYFAGQFDEIRISNKVRSNGWLRTEYNNQSSPSTFYSLSSEAVSYSILSASICNSPITLTFGYPSGGVYSGNGYITGDEFDPPSSGTYPITYTYNGGCGSSSITKNIVITPVPTAPVASNKVYCTGQIANVEATTGVNIKWYSGATLVSTANPFSTGITTPGTYNYTVTQTVNDCESSATPVTLTILTGTTISAHPQPTTTCSGSNATFSVVASGYNMTYQWQEGGVDIADGGIYSGATTPALTLTNPGLAKNGASYRCRIFSTCGTSPITSNAAILTVNASQVATFSYAGTPYCPNASNPSPTFSGGGIAGTFSSTAGLVFISSATGQVDIGASVPGTYTVTNTIAPSGNCSAVVATSPITIISSLSWTGANGTDWNDTGNWSCNFVPTAMISVQIPNVSNKPVINTGITATVNNLTIIGGSSLTVSGTIQIAGTITNAGTFTATNGTVELNGTAAQVIGAGIFAGNTIKDLTINNAAGATLQGPLNITGVVTVSSGSLSSGGYLTLVSTAAGTALISGSGTASVTGNVTMQRYLPSGYGYKYFSSSFQAATVNEFSPEVDLGSSTTAVYKYDENRNYLGTPLSGWANYKVTSNVLFPLSGYAVNLGSSSAQKTIDITGTVNNGPVSTTLYNHDQIYTKGMNLVGNPYPSPIDWEIVSAGNTGIDNAVYFFQASSSDQWGGTYISYVNGASTGGSNLNIIPSLQGFFIHVSDGSYPVTGTLNMTNSVRISDLTHPFTKKKGNASAPVLLRLTAHYSDDPLSLDPLVIYFDEKGTPGFDNQIDALKLLNTDLNVPNLYTTGPDNKILSINALSPIVDDFYQVPLGLKLNRTTPGGIIFKISEIDQSLTDKRIYLTDIIEGVEQDLLPDKEYTISLSAGEYHNRFFLNFSSITTNINGYIQNKIFSNIYSYEGNIRADIKEVYGEYGTLTVHNLSGQLVFTDKIYDTGFYEFKPGLKDGIYIVRYTSDKFIFTKKVIILNR